MEAISEAYSGRCSLGGVEERTEMIKRKVTADFKVSFKVANH